MKRFFFTTLAVIVSITIVIILILGLVLVYRYNESEQQWKSSAYKDYVNYISAQLTPDKLMNMGTSLSDIKLSLENFPNDRISGLFFHSSVNNMAFGIGKTPGGMSISTTSDTLCTDTEGDQEVPDTLFAMTFNGLSFDLVRTNGTSIIDFTLPKNVQGHDIVGSVTFSINGSQLGSVYVLTHTPRTYSYSSDVLNGAIRILIGSIPFALLISLIVAWIFSYRNTKMIESVRASLKQITDPEHDELKLPKNTNPFVEQIYDSIKELDQRLTDNQRNRNEWLRAISHDLNTPVSSLKITMEAIHDEVYEANDPAVIKTISDETSTLESRIHSITEYSQLQSMDHIEKEEIATAALFEEVFELLPAGSSEKIHCNSSIQTINGDRNLLKIACVELLENALDADPSGSSVVWNIKNEDDNFVMEFLNDGVLKDNVDFFEPWSRGDWSRSEGGCGMGLSIVSRIIHLHKGKASIIQGSENVVCVTISWPC